MPVGSLARDTSRVRWLSCSSRSREPTVFKAVLGVLQSELKWASITCLS